MELDTPSPRSALEVKYGFLDCRTARHENDDAIFLPDIGDYALDDDIAAIEEKLGIKVTHVYGLDIGQDDGTLLFFAERELNEEAITEWLKENNITPYDDSYLTEFDSYCPEIYHKPA